MELNRGVDDTVTEPMTVTEAVNRRKSIRAFRPDPVDDDTIARLLVTASRAPSGGNVQPWRIYVVNGEAMARFRQFLVDRPIEPPAYDIYPKGLTEPYRTSRFKIGEDMYATIGIGRDDKPGRLAQFAKNLDFFGAPAAIFCFIDEQMGPPQWSDLGMARLRQCFDRECPVPAGASRRGRPLLRLAGEWRCSAWLAPARSGSETCSSRAHRYAPRA
jgi:hypothetical protein